VFAYHEPFTRAHLVTFGLIWAALAIFSFDAVKRWRSIRSHSAVVAAARSTESPACH
jgi:chloramphenicol-sensitive protein RarD